MNKKFWTEYYRKRNIQDESSFASFVLPFIRSKRGRLVDIGCGDGRDLYFFQANGILAHGVDGSNEDTLIVKQNILSYMNENKSPAHVYARFFWHAIERKEQLAILDWTSKYIYIEARTTKDKPKNVIGRHKRKLVNVVKLEKDLVKRGYHIHSLIEGQGFSKFQGEDPHLVRVVAEKVML